MKRVKPSKNRSTKDNIYLAVVGASHKLDMNLVRQYGRIDSKGYIDKPKTYDKKTLRAYQIYRQLFARFSLYNL